MYKLKLVVIRAIFIIRGFQSKKKKRHQRQNVVSFIELFLPMSKDSFTLLELVLITRISIGEESRWRRNRMGDHFLFYKFIERTTER